MTSNSNYNNKKIGELLLPNGVTLVHFVKWLDETFVRYFPTRKSSIRNLSPLYNDYFDFDSSKKETEFQKAVNIFKFKATAFDIAGGLNLHSRERYEVAKIGIDFVDTRVGLHFILEDIKDLSLIQKFFVGVCKKWPSSEVIEGDWVLGKVEEKRQKAIINKKQEVSDFFDSEGVILLDVLKQYFPDASEQKLVDLQLTQKLWDIQRLTHRQIEQRNDITLSTFKRRKADLREHGLLKRI